MHTYRIELVAPGFVFDSISILLLPAKSWAHAMGMGKRLAQIRKANEQVLVVQQMPDRET